MTRSKSHFEQLLSKIYAKSFCKNNDINHIVSNLFIILIIIVYRLSGTKIK